MKSADGTNQRRTQSDGADIRAIRGQSFDMSRCHISASNIDRRPSEPRLTPDGDLGEPRHVSCEPPHVPPPAASRRHENDVWSAARRAKAHYAPLCRARGAALISVT